MELPWGDDILGEALALLVDWEDPTAGTTAALTATTADCEKKRGREHASPTKSDRSPPRAVKINLSRERQKQEIVQLHERVAELEEDLARLQLRSHKRLRLESLQTSASPGAGAVGHGSVVAWENAARRQFRSRRRAEAVNTKLRDMLSTQMAVAEDLIRVIHRAERARQEAQQMAIFPASSPVFTMANPAHDQHLQRRLFQISSQWHVPFTKCAPFHDHPTRPRELLFYDSTSSRVGGKELVLDIRASTPSAFPLQVVEDMLWTYFLTLRCTEDDFSLATESQESADRLVGCLRATASHDGIHGVLNSRFMKQRFRNVDGELVIASVYCGRPDLRSTDGVGDEYLTTIDAILFEDSWLRVFRVHGPQTKTEGEQQSSSEGITVIQLVRRSRIQFGGVEKPDCVQVDAVESFFTWLAENELRWSQEVMERSMILAPKRGIAP